MQDGKPVRQNPKAQEKARKVLEQRRALELGGLVAPVYKLSSMQKESLEPAARETTVYKPGVRHTVTRHYVGARSRV